MQDWRRNIKPEISIKLEKGASVHAMEVVEDFIYLTSSASRSSLQVKHKYIDMNSFCAKRY